MICAAVPLGRLRLHHYMPTLTEKFNSTCLPSLLGIKGTDFHDDSPASCARAAGTFLAHPAVASQPTNNTDQIYYPLRDGLGNDEAVTCRYLYTMIHLMIHPHSPVRLLIPRQSLSRINH